MSGRSSAEGTGSFESDRAIMKDQIQALQKLIPESRAELLNKAPEIQELMSVRMKLESPESTDESDNEEI